MEINRFGPQVTYQPQVGCLMLLLMLVFLTCIMPLFLLEIGQLALVKLHLSPQAAILVLIGIFLGGMINLPVTVLDRGAEATVEQDVFVPLMGWVPLVGKLPTRTIIAVNVGGCLIPVGLALFEFQWLRSVEPSVLGELLSVVIANIALCYVVARPVPGLGIAMPAFASPLTSVLLTWILLAPDEHAMVRAPVAFIAGVLGPLIGADLLHLRDVTKLAAPMLSIGGAGTFDGIVLSGLLAAFLA